jgi:thioredoxin reductase (NADPH)
MPSKIIYDLIIIGAGPAGLTASIYASRYKLNHLIIGEALGGLAFEAHKICNFPTESEISGPDLIEKIRKHIENLEAPLIMDRVVKAEKEKTIFKITTQNKKIFLSKILLLALGTEHRRLNLKNEDRFFGKGLSYCATCDALFYRDKIVAVYGGANSANAASLYLAKMAKKVYQIYRGNKLRGDLKQAEQVKNNKNIEVIYNTEIVGLEGENKLERIILNPPCGKSKKLSVDGLFVEIGTIPGKALTKQLDLKTDQKGYIQVDAEQKTSCFGVWAAGDITTGSNNFRQIITACAEGAVAADSIFKFFQKN